MSQKNPNVQLKGARLAKNWTQSNACEAAGVADTRSWQRWEAGTSIPSPYYRRKLCAIFDKTPEELGFFMSDALREQQPINSVEKEIVTLEPAIALETSNTDTSKVSKGIAI